MPRELNQNLELNQPYYGNLATQPLFPGDPMTREIEVTTPPVPLTHYLWILRRHLRKILAFMLACVLATFIISARLEKIYESTATVDIDRQAPSQVVGDESKYSENVPNDADQFLATQLKLVQSDAVLRPVAEQYSLLEREGQLKGKTPEQVQKIIAAPIQLKRLKVTRPQNTYLLLISYRSPDAQLAANVANAIARSYLNHTYAIRIRSSASMATFMETQIDELKAKMEKSSLSLAKYEKDLNVVNPEEKTNILSARLLQLNTEYTTAQGERVGAEAAWNAMKSGSVEAAQISNQGEALAKLSDNLNLAQQRFAEIKSTYGPSHPEYRKAASELAEVQKQFDETKKNIMDRIAVQYHEALNREQMLQKAVAEAKAEWDEVNSRSFEYQRLKQEADTDKQLYDELMKKIKESDINAGFQNNNIRIADEARPAMKPVFPKMILNLVLAFLFAAVLGVAAALLQDSLDTTLRDPFEARRFLGIDVIGTLPVDKTSGQLTKSLSEAPGPIQLRSPEASGNGNRRGGYYSAISSFEESVRTLRNTILLADFEQRLRSITVTSATPSEGKTTLSAHLAIANAARGKKTLIVDGDLRRPSLHSKFGLNPSKGLSNVLIGEMSWQDVTIPIEGRPDLTLIPSGPGSHRAADLMGPRLSDLLNEFTKVYDLVILDSPPLLGFAECLQMASAADGVLIVSHAGETKRKAVAAVVSTLQRLRANIIGVVLNQVSQHTSSEGYSYYGYYHYGYYSSYQSPKQG